LSIFRKSVQKIQVSFKSDKNDGYFTRRRMHIYGISLNSTYREIFQRKVVKKISNFFPPKIVPFVR